MQIKKSNFKILIFDIEIVGGGFGADGTTLFTFGWKFVGDKKAQTMTLPIDFAEDFKKDHFNETPILKKLHAIFAQADIAVAHFGSKFDLPYLRTKMIERRLPPLWEPYLIDTWAISKKYLKLRNNRLDTLIAAFGTPTHKTHFNVKLWKKAEHGDLKCARMIDHHCKKDVNALEEVYLLLRDVIATHPLRGSVIKATDKCVGCGGKLEGNGIRRTRVNVYKRYRCRKCGANYKGQGKRWATSYGG